jgi:hypothetical protein
MTLVEALKNRKVVITDDSRGTGADAVHGFHIEEYDGDAANVKGRVRLAPSDELSLRREIRTELLGTPAIELPRPPRSAAMAARLNRKASAIA